MQPVRESLAVAGAVVLVDGRIVHVQLSDQWATRGVTLGAAADHPEGADIVGSVIGAEGAATPDLLGVLNDAFSSEPVVLDVPAGVAVDVLRRGGLVVDRRRVDLPPPRRAARGRRRGHGGRPPRWR